MDSVFDSKFSGVIASSAEKMALGGLALCAFIATSSLRRPSLVRYIFASSSADSLREQRVVDKR
jgi:hypothetical protein